MSQDGSSPDADLASGKTLGLSAILSVQFWNDCSAPSDVAAEAVGFGGAE